MTPEKIVEKEVLEVCAQLKFDVDVVDSKGVFSRAANRYTKNRHIPDGFSDLVGNTENGLAVFIELKAKGKLKTLRQNQRAFLTRKIENGCFACVVDNAESLCNIYLKFISLPVVERPNYLLSTLP